MNKNFKIKYTSKDFDSIRNDIVSYAQRYYPNTVTDLSRNSFSSLVIDAVSYVGDILSYNIDYETNESLLVSSIDSNNILKIGEQFGYKPKTYGSSVGTVDFYFLMPATTGGSAPDYDYSFTIRKGTILGNAGNSSVFTLNEDIKINNSNSGITAVAAKFNTNGSVSEYALKVSGEVISGEILQERIDVGEFQEFLNIGLNKGNIVEIISILDSDGNEYYEVENLANNVIFKMVPHTTTDGVTSTIKMFHAARRFVVQPNGIFTTLKFGGKVYDPEVDVNLDEIFEPSKTVLQKYGRQFTTEQYIEPNKLIKGDLYGIGPANTTLFITYRVNSENTIAANTLSSIKNLNIVFDGTGSEETKKNSIINSFQVTNEEPISTTVSSLTTGEVKNEILSFNQTQNRAVTDRDYETLCYTMPANLGIIKRVKAYRDENSLKSNLNLYVVSQNTAGEFLQTNSVIKNNLKTWLNNYKILTDTVDILDAKIINLGIRFKIKGDPNFNKIELLNNCKTRLNSLYSVKQMIGEPFSINNIYKELNKINGVVDVQSVEVYNKTGTGFSNINYDLEENTTSDGNFILIPKNCVFEIKSLTRDIEGTIN